MQQSLARLVQRGYIVEQLLGPLAHLWFGILARGRSGAVQAVLGRKRRPWGLLGQACG